MCTNQCLLKSSFEYSVFHFVNWCNKYGLHTSLFYSPVFKCPVFYNFLCKSTFFKKFWSLVTWSILPENKEMYFNWWLSAIITSIQRRKEYHNFFAFEWAYSIFVYLKTHSRASSFAHPPWLPTCSSVSFSIIWKFYKFTPLKTFNLLQRHQTFIKYFFHKLLATFLPKPLNNAGSRWRVFIILKFLLLKKADPFIGNIL